MMAPFGNISRLAFTTATMMAATATSATVTLIRINEISDKGTSDGTCGGDDWIELHLSNNSDDASTSELPTSLDGLVLHDDKGPDNVDAFRFDSSFTMNVGEFLLLCCGTGDGLAGPRFKIGGDDEITLREASGDILSTTGTLSDAGEVDVTYAFDDGTGDYSYTTTPTPSAKNILTSFSDTAEGAVIGDADSVRINEVSDKGTSDEICGGNDWVELYLPTTGAETDLGAGYVLHDDNGPNDPDAFNFTSSSLTTTVMDPGDYLLLCCGSEDGSTGPSFKIGGEDTITLRDAAGAVVSSTGKLKEEGSELVTYMYDEASASYVYTSTPTPGSANVLSEPISALDALYMRLDAQNERGMAFFDMGNDGLPVEGGFAPVVDLRMEMDPAIFARMMDDQSFELYSPFLNATVTNRDDPSDVLLELSSPGRIRPKGQSTLAFGTCMNRSIPFSIDWDHVDKSQTLFGAERTYLRNHFNDDSFVREWAAHRMLARFDLPHLRTRTVRFFLNDEYVGLYSLMEVPDQDYVFRRSFGDFDPDDFVMYKVKTRAISCGKYDEETLERAGARINETVTPPYAYERGEHRAKIPVLGEDRWLECSSQFWKMMGVEHEDSALSYLRSGQDCGKWIVDSGGVDRDLGHKSWDDEMEDFYNRHLGNSTCDTKCANSKLFSEVDLDNFLRNFAVYAAVLNQDSPIGNGNNYYLAQSGDGLGWKIVQYDHNNMLTQTASFLCNDAACNKNLIHWSIERPTCRALETNQLAGPLLSDPALRRRYVEHVRAFVRNVLTNATFLDQIFGHIEAIKEDVTDDPWVAASGAFYSNELAEDDEWSKDMYGYPYIPFLPALRARSADILDQLEALDSGAVPPRDLDDVLPDEVCVDWRSEEPASSSSICPSGCLYDGCYRPEFTVPAYCDEGTGICYHGVMDPKCDGVPDGQGYDGIESFEGSDQNAFCFPGDGLVPMKMAACPNQESSSTCFDECHYDGCHRPEFTVPSRCEQGMCYHGVADEECEGVPDLQGYGGIEKFEGSDEDVVCWMDMTLGALKVAQCPPPPAETETSTKSVGVEANSGDLLRISLVGLASIAFGFVIMAEELFLSALCSR